MKCNNCKGEVGGCDKDVKYHFCSPECFGEFKEKKSKKGLITRWE